VKLEAETGTMFRIFIQCMLLSNLASDNGYFDQAHFIKDFKEMSGYTPNNKKGRLDYRHGAGRREKWRKANISGITGGTGNL
jgi:AraC-like DNA-binding protein